MNPYQDIPIWTLTKDGKVARAELRYVEGYGYEARLLFNGEFRQGRAFRGEEQGGKAAKEWAEDWRKDLLTQGWAVV
jgi:hypothetical protein